MNTLTSFQTTAPAANIAEWTAQGERLAADYRNVMWSIAEWLEFGVQQFGAAAQDIALEQFGKSRAELKAAMDVMRRYPAQKRRPGLTYAHHAAVMVLPEPEAEQVLEQAAGEGLSITAVKKAVNKIRESDGGDLFAQMAAADVDILHDDWFGKVIRLINRSPTGDEGRREIFELMDECECGLMVQ